VTETQGRTAIITGVAGQDGSYLAELLLERGYRVVGIHRAATSLERILHIRDRMELRATDLMDEGEIVSLLESVHPHEVYNLAGHSFVPTSWDRPDLPGNVTGLAASRFLSAIGRTDSTIRFYQASSSEIFGNAREEPQTERTPLNPRNPYGAAKAEAHFATIQAREKRGIFSVSGILYNHESPRRGPEFISRKISDGVARISLGLLNTISIGSLDAERDWGFAGDYVHGMWLMLQQDSPSDYVIASGRLHSVRDMCRIAFAHAGLDYQDHVVVDPALVRPPEVVRLVGDPTRAYEDLGWQPKVSFERLLELMVDADLARLQA
jgi:GDPmannose 4,6-dehydratase